MDKEEKQFCEEPAWNLKCIVFSVVLALFYWYAPKKNKWVLLLTLYIPYLLMAYYDYYFDCRRYPLRPTYLSIFYYWAKPADSQQIKDFKDWCPEVKRKILFVDFIILALTIGFLTIF